MMIIRRVDDHGTLAGLLEGSTPRAYYTVVELTVLRRLHC